MAARRLINARLSNAGVTHLDDLAAEITVELGGRNPVTRTEIIRAALVLAFSQRARLVETVLRIRRVEAEQL
jgi:hypothetical protein